MPKVIANNYETHYELDDFIDPWKPFDSPRAWGKLTSR